MTDKEIHTTTTATFEGRPIRRYLGVVAAESARTVAPSNLRTLFSGRAQEANAQGLRDGLESARTNALAELVARARELGANAIVRVDVDHAVVNPQIVVVTATGTAVVVE
ncbi:MAG: heavy metal-binding domain-containing protein [Planctomycetes bacterium]|nr:heavy metal-binding domain-containing protein [Planctomycetota bacterium]